MTKEEEEILIKDGAIPLTVEVKKILDEGPPGKEPSAVAGWVIGLKENEDVLDYLQDVIVKIGEDDEFMEDFKISKGSGKIKFYKKYLKVSALFKHNNVTKIKQTAWDMFLDSYEELKEGFKDEPEPVKAVKQVDKETLEKMASKAKERGGIGAKMDEEKKKEEEIKKKKEMDETRKKEEEKDRKEEEEKARKAEERKKKKK